MQFLSETAFLEKLHFWNCTKLHLIHNSKLCLSNYSFSNYSNLQFAVSRSFNSKAQFRIISSNYVALWDDGLEILKSFERWTKATLPNNLDAEIRELGDANAVNAKTLTIVDVFKSFHLRKIALLMGFAFIAVTIAYYGLAYNAAALPGDLYVNNAINGAVETLAVVYS